MSFDRAVVFRICLSARICVLAFFGYYLHCAFGCTLWHTTCSALAVPIVVFRRYSCCICYWIRFAMSLHLALLDVICSVLAICLQCGCTNSEGLFCSFSCFLGWLNFQKKLSQKRTHRTAQLVLITSKKKVPTAMFLHLSKVFTDSRDMKGPAAPCLSLNSLNDY